MLRVYFSALSTKLRTACAISKGSPVLRGPAGPEVKPDSLVLGTIEVGDGRIDLCESLFAVGARVGQFFEPRSQLRQQRAPVVRDCIPKVTDATDELFDLIEQPIDGLRKQFKLIVATADD